MKKLMLALAAVAAMMGVKAVLPEGCVPADWIQSDGSTSDVSLVFTPNPQADKVVIELEMTDLSKNMFTFSARKGSKDSSWSFNLMGGGCRQQKGASS